MAMNIELLGGKVEGVFHIGDQVFTGTMSKLRRFDDTGLEITQHTIRLQRGDMRVSCNKITTDGGQDVQPRFTMDTQDVPQEQGVIFCLEWMDAVAGGVFSEAAQGGRGIIDADHIFNTINHFLHDVL